MQIKLQNKADLQKHFQQIQTLAEQNEQVCVKYIDLGVSVIRVLCYTPEIIPLMEKQLTYVLHDTMDHYDSTLIVWKANDIRDFIKNISANFTLQQKARMRLEMLMSHRNHLEDIFFMYPDFSAINPVISLNSLNGTIEAYDMDTKTCYYGVDNFDPEEFIKRGHAFVQQINVLIQSPSVNIAHGAIIGFNNNGLLMCARGQRGKSTLTVHAMMHGFEYVSDDYQILENKDGQLLSYPIYSIITLSPTMYNELYDDLRGKFVSNNARKDKYVINIAPYHDQFRTAYPIRLCLFPEIVKDKEPSIKFCTSKEKGRAIVQLIQSTVMQMRDWNNHNVIRTMFNMVKDMDFYKFNLCRDIDANTEYLRTFLKDFDFNSRHGIPIDKVMVDITFDVANILDSQSFTLYRMNEFATNVYENLLRGVPENEIWTKIEPFAAKNPNLRAEFETLVRVVQDYGFIQDGIDMPDNTDINPEFATKCEFRLSVQEFAENETIELIK